MTLSPNAVRMLRLGLLGLLALALLVVGWKTGLRDQLSVKNLRALTASAGLYSVLLYIGAFSVGELMHVPGLVFVAAGVLAWGRVWGGAASWVAAVVSVSVTFFVARGVGGQPLGSIENRLVRRILAQLDARPVRTIFLLRVIFLVSPPINYALALSPVRTRDYLVGSALGLLISVSVTSLVFDRLLFRYLGIA